MQSIVLHQEVYILTMRESTSEWHESGVRVHDVMMTNVVTKKGECEWQLYREAEWRVTTE